MDIPQPQIIHSRRSSLSIEITRNGELIVKAPKLAPTFVINRFLASKKEWIEKTLEKVAKRKPVSKTYIEGEQYLFLGKTLPLHFYSGTKIGIKDNTLYFPKALHFRIQKELSSWYQQQAKEIITKRVELHAKKMNTTYKDIFFSDTSSKWGTCFGDNTLQFNWRLVMTPLMVLDYVVIHELTHTTEKHHQDSFWRRVKLFTPAYKQHRKWLEHNAHLLQI